MKEYNLSNVSVGNSVVALGKFQGLHKGHMLLINKIIELSKNEQLTSVVLTIDIKSNKLINVPSERYEILNSKKVDVNVIVEFTESFAALSPEEFVKSILIDKLHVKYVVVGADFRFGYKRLGDVRYLKSMGEKYGFSVIAFEKLQIDDTVVSTTYIKELILKGDMKKVSMFLDREFSVSGQIIKGKQLGRTIGFPTANICVDDNKLLPPKGAYSTKAIIDGIEYKAITNIGYNPTVGGNDNIIIETHILEFNGDIYSKTIKVKFVDYLRPEYKVESIEELKKQLERAKMFVMHQ